MLLNDLGCSTIHEFTPLGSPDAPSHKPSSNDALHNHRHLHLSNEELLDLQDSNNTVTHLTLSHKAKEASDALGGLIYLEFMPTPITTEVLLNASRAAVLEDAQFFHMLLPKVHPHTTLNSHTRSIALANCLFTFEQTHCFPLQ